MRTIYALCYRPGPAWLPGKPVFEQPLGEHIAYMRSLIATGAIVLGGPYTDDTGGLVAVNADSLADAIGVFRADPAVRDGVMMGEVHPWRVVGGRFAAALATGTPPNP